MKTWWLSLAARERRLLGFGAAVLAAAALYAGVWSPLDDERARLRTATAAARADLAWMRAAAARLDAVPVARAAGAAGAVAGPLPRRLEQSAQAAGISASLRQLDAGADGRLAVRFEAVAFDALLPWLETLAAQGVRVVQFDIEREPGAGRVSARLVLDGR